MAGVLDAVKNNIYENESKRDSLFVLEKFFFFTDACFSILILHNSLRRKEAMQSAVLTIEDLKLGSSILV